MAAAGPLADAADLAAANATQTLHPEPWTQNSKP